MLDPEWRQFELTTRIEPLRNEGVTRAWAPLPSLPDSDWQRSLGNRWDSNAQMVRQERDGSGADMLFAQWEKDTASPWLEVVTRVSTRDRSTDFARPADTPLALPPDERDRYTRASRLLPVDGIVLNTAMDIVGGAGDDETRARAIYEWIVTNTQREPTVRGCGTGDIRAMLETGNLAGKCADLNALFVGLARAAGLPARDLYGVRVADSRLGYKSLGKSGDVSKAQHCRAEVFLQRYGWVPVDPADVRKVILEEPPGSLTLSDPKVVHARERLFGGWEMNWLAFNDAHDVSLPGSQGPEVPFLMYPQGEDARGRFYSLDPASFRYTLTARDVGRDRRTEVL
jgi:transglutaminase-like putative cysteine protease